ncbi:MAG TPA: VOC family protein [Candidatus Polarisedimenticolia bacterium]|jgi:predicted enzyme related to lactoylglutathione lyase|nr:VOC family protein [Candidatus Polarisedimenticolia bacterium]
MAAATFLGLRTVVYKVGDLAKATAWYRKALGIDPYFEQPYYVGFSVGGYELGLDPDTSDQAPGAGGSVAYWGVADADAALKHLTASGGKPHMPLRDVGDGIRVASVLDPFGNVLGLIQNPHFKLPGGGS